MRVKSVSSVHALVFCLGLTCTDGYGMNNPMDNHQVNPGNNFANMPVESLDILQRSGGSTSGSFEQNPNIDYDSLSKDELLRMFLRLEEQNRQQTQMLIAQNEEYRRRIESLEAASNEQRRHNMVMENLTRQQSSAAAAREREREAAKRREKQAEKDGIRRRINQLKSERDTKEDIIRRTPPPSYPIPRWQYDEEMAKQRAKREAAGYRR